MGHILENIVYLELLRRGYNVSVGKIDVYITKNGKKIRETLEVDFVAQKPGEPVEYYQVALYVLDDKTLERELMPLQKIRDNNPKYILSMDYGTGDNNGIKRINVLDWFLDIKR